MRHLVTIVLLIAFGICVPHIPAEEMSQAIWWHQLYSNRLKGDKATELWVHSAIITGYSGVNSSQRFGQEIKVDAWGKPFSVTSPIYQRPDEPNGPKYKEVFTTTLWETDDPKELRAEFEHTVYRDGKIFLRFSGITLVDNRWSGT